MCVDEDMLPTFIFGEDVLLKIDGTSIFSKTLMMQKEGVARYFCKLGVAQRLFLLSCSCQISRCVKDSKVTCCWITLTGGRGERGAEV